MTTFDVINELAKATTLDSDLLEDGWSFDGHSNGRYVSCNIMGRGGIPKIVYLVVRRNGLLQVGLRISLSNPNLEKIEKLTRGESFKGDVVKSGGDYTIYRDISGGEDETFDVIKERVRNGLDDLYAMYNAYVQVQRDGDRAQYESCGRCTVFNRPVVMTPEYELAWGGWDRFRARWDAFVAGWLASGAHPDDGLTKMSCEAVNGKDPCAALNIAELPEPYYGDGSTCAGVIVHLNPGASSLKERSKIYGDAGSWLVKSLVSRCKGRYSVFEKLWSPLRTDFEDGKTAADVPGSAEWWHCSSREAGVRRLCNASVDRLFALEACPFHSGAWKGRMEILEEHVVDNVIAPAIVAAANPCCKRHCAVFVGSQFISVITKIKGVSQVLPQMKGSRTYTLFKYDVANGIVDQPVFLLVVNGCQGMALPQANSQNLQIEDEVIRSCIGV